MGKLTALRNHIFEKYHEQDAVPYHELIALIDETDKDDTVDLNIAATEFEKIALCLEAGGFKMMAQNFGCDDDDFAEVLDEDRDSEIFIPNEYDWQVWK